MTTYSNPRLAATVENWPHGAHRTTAIFAIERDPKRGERATRVTIDPKTGRLSRPKLTTFAVKTRIVDGDDGRTYIACLTNYGFVSIMHGNMQFQHETWDDRDDCFPAIVALFEGGE